MLKARMFKRLLGAVTAVALSLTGVWYGGVTAKAEETASYTITIPSTLPVRHAGWNPLEGGITVTGDLAGKSLKVKADSENDFNLVKSVDNTKKIGYTLNNANGDAAGEKTNYWIFTESGSRDVGVNVEENTTGVKGTFKDTVTFKAGIQKIVDLSTLTGSYTARDEEVLTGTLQGNYKISVADKANVTLRDVTITDSNTSYAGISCNGDVTAKVWTVLRKSA